MRPLEGPLAQLVGDELAPSLARILFLAYREGKISVEELREETPLVEELLFEACRLRMLLPASPSVEWSSRRLKAAEGELYEMPRVIRCLVREAIERGRWDPERAIAEAFREIGEEDWEDLPALVRRLFRRARGLTVTAKEIKEVAEELGLGEKVDPLIAELKATGVMSPKVGSLSEALKARSPIYELNPCLKENLDPEDVPQEEASDQEKHSPEDISHPAGAHPCGHQPGTEL